MRMIEDAGAQQFSSFEPFSPYSEAVEEANTASFSVGFSPWNEAQTPFAEASDAGELESETEQLLAETFAELRDESFDEALAYLAEETEQVVSDRFTGETSYASAERERFAEAYLSPVRFEAEQYLTSLEQGLAGLDVESMTEEQLDEVLDRFDPPTGELTVAGEEFIGGLIRKAKKAVKSVVKTVGKVATGVVKGVGKVAGAVIGPVLKKLKALVNPLLKRVLSFAIGRLPAPLQPAARELAKRITSEVGENEENGEAPMSPANLTDVEVLAESFDAALAEAMVVGDTEMEGEEFNGGDNEGDIGGRELQTLAEARAVLIDRIRTAGDEEDMAPAIEQFVPALLAALRLGINLVGRPKVVGFLAKYLGQLIRRWVGPKLSEPLSNAIVDIGLRLITLEAEAAEAGEAIGEAGPIALASVVEDTVRRLSENEDYIFENEDLMQLAAAEAFGEAVATHFPSQFVRPALQHAPLLGGTFVARRPRNVRTYRKYNRTPEVEITSQIADQLPTFGGSTVGQALRAANTALPMRARVHIYQSAPGTTLSRMVKLDPARNGAARGFLNAANVHPLTPNAAGALLREPKLGVTVPGAYLKSRHRIAAGQRFYVLEPVGKAGVPGGTPAGRAAAGRMASSRAWISVNRRRGRITVGVYLSEVETQQIVQAIRQGQGSAKLLQALVATFQSMKAGGGGPVAAREDGEDFEDFAARAGKQLPQAFKAQLRQRLRAWVLPALAAWSRTNGEAFARAAAHPDPGVTVRIRFTSVPGLNGGVKGGPGAQRAAPPSEITITPGTRKP